MNIHRYEITVSAKLTTKVVSNDRFLAEQSGRERIVSALEAIPDCEVEVISSRAMKGAIVVEDHTA